MCVVRHQKNTKKRDREMWVSEIARNRWNKCNKLPRYSVFCCHQFCVAMTHSYIVSFGLKFDKIFLRFGMYQPYQRSDLQWSNRTQSKTIPSQKEWNRILGMWSIQLKEFLFYSFSLFIIFLPPDCGRNTFKSCFGAVLIVICCEKWENEIENNL